MAEADKRVLVCTDCLSEGINLQATSTRSVHYDLSWNPTRHEQREGRVDRFGQSPNGARADLLRHRQPHRRHRARRADPQAQAIKSDLGVSVAVPGSSEQIAEALFEGALFREKTRAGGRQLILDFIDDLTPKKQAIHTEWENTRDREKASRSRFAQHTLRPEAVAAELQSVRAAIGRSEDVARFLTPSFRRPTFQSRRRERR